MLAQYEALLRAEPAPGRALRSAKRVRRSVYPQTPAVAAFQRFYTENQQRLRPTETYGVNIEALNTWQSSLGQRGETRSETRDFERQFGRVVARGIQHISFAEFLESLRRASYEARDLSLREDLPIVLYVPLFSSATDVVFWRKSNFWVSLLIWPFIADRVADVVDDSTLTAYTNRGVNRRPFLFLLADDGAFSGQQLAGLLPELGDVGERDAVMLVLGALSSVARTHFEQTWRNIPILYMHSSRRRPARPLVLPSQPIHMPTLGEVARATLTDDAELDMFLRYLRSTHPLAFGVEADTTLAYFDHKLPDQVSTLTDLFALAPIDEGGRVTLRSLIENCTPAAYHIGEKYRSYADVPKVGDNNNCPPAFYKAIAYTSGGRPVAGGKNLGAIMSDE